MNDTPNSGAKRQRHSSDESPSDFSSGSLKKKLFKTPGGSRRIKDIGMSLIPKECLYCRSDLTDSDNFLNCCFCKQYFEPGCHGLPTSQFEFFKTSDTTIFCRFCDPTVKKILDHEKRLDILTGDVETIKQKYDELSTNYVLLQDRVCQLEKRLVNVDVNTSTVKFDSSVPKVFIDKSREIINRASSLLCGALHEKNGVDDNQLVNEISDLIGYDISYITNCFRIGKVRDNNKIRLLKIQFVSASAAQNFLSRVHKQMQTVHSKFPKVWFGLDLCLEERQYQQALQNELKEKRKNDPNLVIFRGRIITRNKQKAADETMS